MAKKKVNSRPLAAILVRESSDSQDPDSQINLCLKNADRFGFDVPEEYQFVEHASGMDGGIDRITVVQLKEAIETVGNIKAVFISELTRITRDTFHLVDEIQWFCKHKVPIYIDDYDEWTGEIKENGEFELNKETRDHIFLNASYGEKEWLKIRKRTVRGRKRSSRKGLSIGIVSDGYKIEVINKERHIVIDTKLEDGTFVGRAKVIKDIFDMYTINRFSTDKIAGILNNNQIPSFSAYEAQKNKHNKNVKQTFKIKGIDAEKRKEDVLWSGASIGAILKNKWYIGERTITWTFDEESPREEKHEHEPIITVEQFEEAQKILLYNKKEITKRRENTYPLSRIFFCGKCGAPMLGHKVRINSSYYCSSLEKAVKCGNEGICKQNADAIVWHYISYIPIYYLTNRIPIDGLSSVFSLSKVDKEAILQENLKLKSEIDTIETYISKCRKQVVGFQKLILGADDNEQIPYYQEEISNLEKSIAQKTKEKNAKAKTIDANNHLISEDESIDSSIMDKIVEITKNKDIDAVSSIIHKLIKKVVLYHLFDSYKLIEIEIAYKRKFYAIYNSRKLKGKFIRLPFNNEEITYNASKNVFSTNYALGWCKFFIGIGDKDFERWSLRTVDEESFNNMYQEWYDENVPYLKNEFSPQEFISLLDFKKGIYEVPILRVEEEPSDEEYLSWKEDYKEWSKQRSIRRTEERRANKKENKSEE